MIQHDTIVNIKYLSKKKVLCKYSSILIVITFYEQQLTLCILLKKILYIA